MRTCDRTSVALTRVRAGHRSPAVRWPISSGRPTGRTRRPTSPSCPPAGGAVPKARSLTSAVRRARPAARVRVVCAGRRRGSDVAAGWLLQLDPQGAQARLPASGPSQPVTRSVHAQAGAGAACGSTPSCAQKCRYKSIQAAVNASRNNDRVVIMPGRYTRAEVARQAAPTTRSCNPSLLQKDASGSPTPSYAYQANCPNDQNLIYVQGRARHRAPPRDAAEQPPGHPRAGAGRVRALQPPDRGLGPQADGRDPRRRQELHGAERPVGQARRLRQARGAARRPRRRLRRPQLPHARRRWSSASTPRRPTACCSTRRSSSGTPTTAT